MTSISIKLGRLVATLWLAFVVSFAGLTSGHSADGASSHMSVEKTGSPCGKSMPHETHNQVEPAAEFDEETVMGGCCNGTFCAGDTVRASEVALSGTPYDVIFIRVPPDAFERAIISGTAAIARQTFLGDAAQAMPAAGERSIP